MRDSVISVAIRTRGPCSMKALSDVLRRKDRDSRKTVLHYCTFLLTLRRWHAQPLYPYTSLLVIRLPPIKMFTLRDLLAAPPFGTHLFLLRFRNCAEVIVQSH